LSHLDKLSSHRYLQPGVFLLALTLTAGLLAWLGEQHPINVDLTSGSRHSLSSGSKAVVSQLQNPLAITAFASNQGNLRQRIRTLLSPYLNTSELITLSFVDPDQHPALVRQLEIKADGELRLEYQNRSRQLTTLNELTITQTILQLQRNEPPLLLFLSGHGERSANRGANHDLSNFAETLKAQEFELRTVLPAAGDPLPRHGILVITRPAVELLAADKEAIAQFLADGGQLLWLTDPGPASGHMEFLSRQLGIRSTTGTIVDPNARLIRAPETFVVARPGEYGNHPATAELQFATVLPEACALSFDQDTPWQQSELIRTARHGWVENSPLTDSVRFDPGSDQPGPHLVGVALTRGQQRIVVMCDGDFLSNRYLGNGGNLQLGLNLVNWLANTEQFLDIPQVAAADTYLQWSERQGVIIGFGLLFVLPIGFLSVALLLWRRRRRAL